MAAFAEARVEIMSFEVVAVRVRRGPALCMRKNRAVFSNGGIGWRFLAVGKGFGVGTGGEEAASEDNNEKILHATPFTITARVKQITALNISHYQGRLKDDFKHR